MISRRRRQDNGITASKVVCAIAFCLFTFPYIFYYQTDILAVSQHVLSGGATHYNRDIGAVVITAVLLLLQMAVAALTRLSGSRHALTYFPSMLILAIATSPDFESDGCKGFGVWTVLAPVLFVAWILEVFVARRVPYGRPSGKGMSARALWVNTLTMCAMFMFVGVTGNSDDVYHYRMRTESCLLHGDIDGALEAGANSLRTDSNLTMLRAYALAQKGALAEELFTYPVSGKGRDLVPMPTGTYCLMYPTDSIYRFLGAKPAAGMTAEAYLRALLRSRKATAAVRDYLLCACLIDRDLDSFAQLLPKFYDTNGHLPRHYREALTLYTHLRSNPSVTYHDDVTSTDFKDLQALEKQYADWQERKLAVFDHYSGTYWWYYEYAAK